MKLNMSEIYKTNEDFKNYVDKYCREWEIEKETAFEEYIIIEVAKAYTTGCNSRRGKINEN